MKKFTANQFKSLTRTCKDPEAADKAAAILNDSELDPDQKLNALDVVLDGFGVEGVRVEGAWIDNYHGDIVASYVNQGDTYTETVVYDHETDEFHVTSWGDWLEAWELEHERLDLESGREREEVEAE